MQNHLQCNGGRGVGLLKYPAILCNEHYQVQLHEFFLLSLFSLYVFLVVERGHINYLRTLREPGKITVKSRTFVFCTHCPLN